MSITDTKLKPKCVDGTVLMMLKRDKISISNVTTTQMLFTEFSFLPFLVQKHSFYEEFMVCIIISGIKQTKENIISKENKMKS